MPKRQSLPYRYKWPRPSVTADCVLFGVDDDALKVLLIQRKHDPFAGKWAFPGGFVNEDEPIIAAACRELHEETGLQNIELREVGAFGDPGRDPRGWTVTIAHWALVNVKSLNAAAADDAADVGWFIAAKPPPLGFDHDKILAVGKTRLREHVMRHPIGIDLLPKHFTLVQLQMLYETLLGQKLNTARFRRAIGKLGHVTRASGRNGDLVRFDGVAYRRLRKQGLYLEP
jgi:8-oxo-dGTP diphosphatase